MPCKGCEEAWQRNEGACIVCERTVQKMLLFRGAGLGIWTWSYEMNFRPCCLLSNGIKNSLIGGPDCKL